VAWDLDVKTGHDEWFGYLKTIFGIPSGTVAVRREDFYRFVHPDDCRRVSEAVDQGRRNHSSYAEEFRVVHEDGTVRWITATGEFQYSKRGEPLRMLGIAADITERHRNQEARHQVRRTILQSISRGSSDNDPDQRARSSLSRCQRNI
jgi:PAS domain-containing protein